VINSPVNASNGTIKGAELGIIEGMDRVGNTVAAAFGET